MKRYIPTSNDHNDKSTRLVLQDSLNRFDIDAERFLQRYIELNSEHEDVVMTMAE